MGAYQKILFTLILILLAISERLWFDLGPNVELVTMAAFIAAVYLGRGYAIFIPLLILGISDMKLGNTNIMLFTWSAYVFAGLAFWTLKNLFKNKILFGFAGATGSSVWFYLWTNFGVWFLGSFGMYPKTLVGLVTCYINGLPFLKYNLSGNLIFIPLGVAVIELINLVRRYSLINLWVCLANARRSFRIFLKKSTLFGSGNFLT